jgi:hypothetical protein
MAVRQNLLGENRWITPAVQVIVVGQVETKSMWFSYEMPVNFSAFYYKRIN